MAHRAVHLAGERRHGSDGGSHVERRPQDRRRLCLVKTSKLFFISGEETVQAEFGLIQMFWLATLHVVWMFYL